MANEASRYCYVCTYVRKWGVGGELLQLGLRGLLPRRSVAFRILRQAEERLKHAVVPFYHVFPLFEINCSFRGRCLESYGAALLGSIVSQIQAPKWLAHPPATPRDRWLAILHLCRVISETLRRKDGRDRWHLGLILSGDGGCTRLQQSRSAYTTIYGYLYSIYSTCLRTWSLCP
jgi:hypothetical protein